jgi:hypothetical protein
MGEPRHGQTSANQTATVTFSGYTYWPSDAIKLQAQDMATPRWDTFGTTITATSQPSTDSAGQKWYLWQRDTKLPTATKYWRHAGSGSSRTVRIRLRALTANGGGPTYTFRTGSATEDCINDQGINGAALIEHCSRDARENLPWEEERLVEVIVACGDKNESCCKAAGVSSSAWCASGLACSSSNACVTAPPPPPLPPPVTPTLPPPPPPTCTAGNPCDVRPAECNPAYPTSNVQGRTVCSSGVSRCVATEGVDYCKYGNHGAPNLCGGAATQRCYGDEDCAPGTVCNTYPVAQGGGGCEPIGCTLKQDYCWPVRSSTNAPAPPGASNTDACIF